MALAPSYIHFAVSYRQVVGAFVRPVPSVTDGTPHVTGPTRHVPDKWRIEIRTF